MPTVRVRRFRSLRLPGETVVETDRVTALTSAGEWTVEKRPPPFDTSEQPGTTKGKNPRAAMHAVRWTWGRRSSHSRRTETASRTQSWISLTDGMGPNHAERDTIAVDSLRVWHSCTCFALRRHPRIQVVTAIRVSELS